MIAFESYFIDLVGRKASYFLGNIILKRPLCSGASQKKVSGQFLRAGHYDLQNGKMYFENIQNKFQVNSNRYSWRFLMLSVSLAGFLTWEILLISGFMYSSTILYGLRSRSNGILLINPKELEKVDGYSSRGQLISKCIFGFFNFLQKLNENRSIWGFIVVK